MFFVFSGSLFEPEHESQEEVLKYAIKKINQRRDILPLTTLSYEIDTVPAQDSFEAAKKGEIELGVVLVTFNHQDQAL